MRKKKSFLHLIVSLIYVKISSEKKNGYESGEYSASLVHRFN